MTELKIKLFVSYSHIDRPIVNELVSLLRPVYGSDSIWFDDNLRGGDDWREEIQREINKCDSFLYILSDDSINSEQCQLEYEKAKFFRKHIIPILIRSRTSVPSELLKLQYVDLSKGLKDLDSITGLHAAIHKRVVQLSQADVTEVSNLNSKNYSSEDKAALYISKMILSPQPFCGVATKIICNVVNRGKESTKTGFSVSACIVRTIDNVEFFTFHSTIADILLPRQNQKIIFRPFTHMGDGGQEFLVEIIAISNDQNMQTRKKVTYVLSGTC